MAGTVWVTDNDGTPISLKGTVEEDWIVFSKEDAREIEAAINETVSDPIIPLGKEVING